MTVNLKFRQLASGAFGFTHYKADKEYADFCPVHPATASGAARAAQLKEAEVRSRFYIYPGLAGVEELDDTMLIEYAALVSKSGMKTWQIVWADRSSAVLLVSGNYGVIPAKLWQLAYTAARRMLEMSMPTTYK
jgi:hypothetical protein